MPPLAGCRCLLRGTLHALDILGLDGFVLFTNSNGAYLGDSVLEPVFEELERRKTVVYVHPNPSPDAVAHSLGLPDNLLDFPTDTNRAVAQMHYTNRFARTPNVKYIFSHAGGSIPYLAARFAIIDEMGFIAGGGQRGAAADMFRRIYWDTALAASDPVLRMLRDVAGINQVLYGTDFPYLRRDLAVRSKQRILQSSELNDSERQSILWGNAAFFRANCDRSRRVAWKQREVQPELIKELGCDPFRGIAEQVMVSRMTFEEVSRVCIGESWSRPPLGALEASLCNSRNSGERK